MAGLLNTAAAAVKGLLGSPVMPAPDRSSAPPATPTLQHYMHPTRDAILQTLGGAAGRLDNALQQHDTLRYQTDRLTSLASQIKDPDLQRAFLMAPDQVMSAIAENFKPHDTHAGDTTTFTGLGGQRQFTAPKMDFDPGSGAYVTQTPGRTYRTGQLGGDMAVTPGGTAYSKRTGDIAFQEPQFHTYKADENAGFATPTIAGAGAPPTGGTGAAAVTGAPAPSGGTGASQRQPRGVRNNNFGNLKPVPGGWQGQVGVDPGGYAIFDTPEAGIHAADTNLQAYAGHGINTLRGVIMRWAPPGENNTDAYVGAVSKMTGLHPDQQIDLADPAVRQQILPALFRVENGKRVGSTPPRQAQAQAAPAGPAGGRMDLLAHASSPRLLSGEETVAAGFAPGTQVQRAPDGSVSVVQAPQWGATQALELRGKVIDSQEYKQAQSAMAAYQAMLANADKMTGPSAYAILDTFARAINPGAVARPTVIKTIEDNLGLPAHVVGKLGSMSGQGQLPPQTRQQILDAVVGFVQSHWDQANSLNQSNVEFANRHGMKPEDVTAPLDKRPERMDLSAPKPGSYQNPARPTSVADKATLSPGSYFVNPADGQVYQIPKKR
jgi:hypothetical protein